MGRTPTPITIPEIAAAVERARGDLTAAAEALGISRAAIYDRIRRRPDLRRAVDSARSRARDERLPRPCPQCRGTGMVTGAE